MSVTSVEEPEQILNIAAMRRAIVWGALESDLIREGLEVAERHDLDEEEMYVWLAYHALVRLKKVEQTAGEPEPALTFAVDGHF